MLRTNFVFFCLLVVAGSWAAVSAMGCATSEGDDQGDGDADADGDGDGDADGDADGDSDGDSDADGDTDADGDADGDSDVELCNGLDDDGDGDIDEGDPESGVFCVTGDPGECAAGRTACVEGEVLCAAQHAPAPEACDNFGRDDDCNGALDDIEGLGDDCDTGLDGVCAGGTVDCDGAESICLPLLAPSPEGCANGRDDDCNGVVDDGPAVVPETCANPGRDDDCNGVADDVPGLLAACDTGDYGICGAGTQRCIGGALTCDPDRTARLEVCPLNGLDDDCNGLVDDGLEPEPETCANPGIDDDCNGTRDDVPEVGTACDTGLLGVCGVGRNACVFPDLVCQTVRNPGAEICNNLVDEDCDGQVDEAGCINRTELMLCGGSSRDVAAFIPDDRALDVVVGCSPSDLTQALFITRGGVNLFDGQELQAYLDAGGLVITEYNTTATIFNAAFDEAVVLGAREGACQDNVNPEVQVTPLDRFWQDNVFAAEDQSGCGYDMSAYPDIVPLGAWRDGAVSLAYRDRGLGRLWLVEADWQDGEAAFDADSTALMKYMVGWAP